MVKDIKALFFFFFLSFFHFIFIVNVRDSQGMHIPIDNFYVRFESINQLEEPDHQAILKLANDTVKKDGEEKNFPIEQYNIRNRSDVNESYLDSK